MSGIVNKIKEAVHGDKTHHHGAPEGTHGPHSSRAANAMDPRVDSDRDNSRTMGTGRTAGHGESGSTGYGTGTTGSSGYGTGTTGSTGYSTGTAEGTHGPHSSRAANALDPRVDSDRDNSRTMGTGRTAGHGEFGSSGYGTGTTGSSGYGTGTTGSSGYGTGTTGSSGYSTGTAEGMHGPHSSRAANALDPRVDSDRDNSRTMGTGTGYGSSTTGYGAGTTGMTGTHGAPEGTYGPHGSRMANAADPRVDSDRDNSRTVGSGPGPARHTAGPHKSDMANKMDPRVDSDLDGSKTMGGNRTYQ